MGRKFIIISVDQYVCGGPMSLQQIFILWFTPLFYDSLRWLLKHPDIKFVGATSNYSEALTEILNAKPNIILIEDNGKEHNEMVMEYFDTSHGAKKVIFLGLTDKKLVVYHHEQRSLVKSEDLLELILSELR